MANLPPNDPRSPKIVTTETVTERAVPTSQVVVQKRPSNSGPLIVGLSLVALVLVAGYFMTRKPEPDVTTVSVNNRPVVNPTAVETRVVVTEDSRPADVDVFVEATERDITVLSRPDDAANQAEIAAIREGMEQLRRADAADAAAVRADLEAKIARLRASNSASTTVTTTDTGTATVATTAPTGAPANTPAMNPGESSGVESADLDGLNKRVDDASALIGQLQSTAAPTAAEQVKALQEQLVKVQEEMAKLSAATGQEQVDMLASVESQVASLEQSVKSVPVQ